MAYQKQVWREYDDTKTELQNALNGALATPERLNHIENGIANSADKAEVTAQLQQTERSLNAQLAQTGNNVSELSARVGELSSTATFKGADTYANIVSKTVMAVGDEWWDTTNNRNVRWNGKGWVDVGGLFRVSERTITGEKLGLDLQEKLGTYNNEGIVIQNGTIPLPVGTTRFNNIPSNSSGNVEKIFLNVLKVGTAKLKVIEKMTETTFKTIFDQTVTLNKLGKITLQPTVDFQKIEIKEGQFLAWRGITAELGYSSGGSAFYAPVEGGISAEQTFIHHELTLDFGWQVRGEGSLISELARLNASMGQVEDFTITPIKFKDAVKSKNIFNVAEYKKDHYVNQNTGIITPGVGNVVTGYIPIISEEDYITNIGWARRAYYDGDKHFIIGEMRSDFGFTPPPNAKYVVLSTNNESVTVDPSLIQIEKGDTVTDFEPFGYKIPKKYLEIDDSESVVTSPPFVGDEGKKYRFVGANIRTPEFEGDTFKLHIDSGHETAGITSATLVDNGMELRLGMPFTADKVITMNVTPHISMRNADYEVATAGGLSVHGLWFYKNGARVPAKDVVITSGSFWYFGVFLV